MNSYTTSDYKNHASAAKGLVWDLPTRLFHWLTVAAFAGAWLTSDDSRYVYFHVFCGYLFGGMLMFRLLWGIWGSHHSRFANFAYSLRSAKDYLNDLRLRQARRYIGHNPAGSWAVFLMLPISILLVISGLVTLGGNEHAGPLSAINNYALAASSAELHNILAWILLAWAGIHLSGVITESIYHREKLTPAMITGRKHATPDQPETRHHNGLGMLLIAIILSGAGYYFKGYLTHTSSSPFTPYTGPELAQDKDWISECKDCHLPYHPSLLPARSWERIFAEQNKHFGDDLDLDEETVAELKTYALRNSAEKLQTKAASLINSSIPAKDAPIRITKTSYWEQRHEEIDDTEWREEKVKSKANCDACHRDAKQGVFRPNAMDLP